MPRQSSRQFVFTCAVVFLLLLTPLGHAAGTGDITLVNTVQVDDIARVDEIPLAIFHADSEADGTIVFGLKWAKDTSAWFPTWGLYLTSDMGLLPGGARSIQVSRTSPILGHTYEVTLSVSPSTGALAIRVTDTHDNRVVYADSVAVAAYDGTLAADAGTTSPGYLPVSATWDTGIGEPGATFLPVYVFETVEDPAAIRLRTPAPYPTGEYRVFLEHGDATLHIASVTPSAPETWIPLPLNEAALGESTLTVEYVQDGEVLMRETRSIILGRLDMWMEPVAVERDQGVVRATFNLSSAAPILDEVVVEVTASVEELVWDGGRRQFDYVPYKEERVHRGTVDLSTSKTTLTVEMPVPEKEGNWRVRFEPKVEPELATYVHGQERLFSTHLPATVAAGEAYTIVVFPDTQYFSARHPHIYTRMTDWVTANADEYNIAALLHAGDITDNNSTIQWENAYRSMSLLHGVVPYVLTIGNHDMVGPNGVYGRNDTRVNNYFPVEAAKRYSNLAGTMVPDRIENSYSLFTIGDDKYVVISLEFGPPDEALAWANEVAAAYPDHRMIFLTHSYLARNGNLSSSPTSYPIAQNPETTVNGAAAMWEKFVRRQPNAFMVISGHTSPDLPTVPYRQSRAAAGQWVYQLLFDFQNQQPYEGNGWFGLMTFHPDGTVQVRLYSPFLDEWGNYRDGNGYTSQLVIGLEQGTVRRIY